MIIPDHTDDLIITDTSPLITLALGDQLHALTAPGLRVVIPDAVWVEATRIENAPGASELIEWIARNDDRVTTRPTEVGQDQLQRLRDGRPIRGMGEAAALEVLKTTAEYHPFRHLFLIFEDKDLEKRAIILPERAYAITTGDWLRLAERKGLIQSADEALDRAAARGRTVDRQRIEGSRREAIEAAEKSLAANNRGGRSD